MMGMSINTVSMRNATEKEEKKRKKKEKKKPEVAEIETKAQNIDDVVNIDDVDDYANNNDFTNDFVDNDFAPKPVRRQISEHQMREKVIEKKQKRKDKKTKKRLSNIQQQQEKKEEEESPSKPQQQDKKEEQQSPSKPQDQQVVASKMQELQQQHVQQQQEEKAGEDSEPDAPSPLVPMPQHISPKVRGKKILKEIKPENLTEIKPDVAVGSFPTNLLDVGFEDLGGKTEHTNNLSERGSRSFDVSSASLDNTNISALSDAAEKGLDDDDSDVESENDGEEFTCADDNETLGDNTLMTNLTGMTRFEELLYQWRTRETNQIEKQKELIKKREGNDDGDDAGSRVSYLSEDEDQSCFEGVMKHWKKRRRQDRKNSGNSEEFEELKVVDSNKKPDENHQNDEVDIAEDQSEVSSLGESLRWDDESDSRFDMGFDARHDTTVISPRTKRRMLKEYKKAKKLKKKAKKEKKEKKERKKREKEEKKKAKQEEKEEKKKAKLEDNENLEESETAEKLVENEKSSKKKKKRDSKVSQTSSSSTPYKMKGILKNSLGNDSSGAIQFDPALDSSLVSLDTTDAVSLAPSEAETVESSDIESSKRKKKSKKSKKHKTPKSAKKKVKAVPPLSARSEHDDGNADSKNSSGKFGYNTGWLEAPVTVGTRKKKRSSKTKHKLTDTVPTTKKELSALKPMVPVIMPFVPNLLDSPIPSPPASPSKPEVTTLTADSGHIPYLPNILVTPPEAAAALGSSKRLPPKSPAPRRPDP